jgi:hypothetical protein
MERVTFPRGEADRVLSLLLSGDRFEVLAQTRFDDQRAAFVLGRLGWTWGHFFRSAFCSLSPAPPDDLALEISHLDAHGPWHGRNLFRGADRKIEEEIAAHMLASLPGARVA